LIGAVVEPLRSKGKGGGVSLPLENAEKGIRSYIKLEKKMLCYTEYKAVDLLKNYLAYIVCQSVICLPFNSEFKKVNRVPVRDGIYFPDYTSGFNSITNNKTFKLIALYTSCSNLRPSFIGSVTLSKTILNFDDSSNHQRNFTL
jgi:hypothetical protein